MPTTNHKGVRKMIQRIKCFFGFHDMEIVHKFMTRGLFFGGMVEAKMWGCSCGYIASDYTITESI